MARNIRNISIKAYTVTYAVAMNGKLTQATGTFDTNSPRKLTRMIAEDCGCDIASVVIISSEEVVTEYRIADIVKAMELLKMHGFARIMNRETKPEK